MSQTSNYLKNALINTTLRNTSYTSPTTIYLALYTTDPTDADTGGEVSGGSYARQSIAFSAPSNGVTSNTSDILFPVATANWGTVAYFGLRDALTGGNLLYHNQLATARAVNTDNQIIFKAGQITCTLS